MYVHVQTWEGWFRLVVLELVCFAARSGTRLQLQPSLHCSLQQAGRTWHREMADQMCMVIDRPRPRSTYSAGAGEEVSPFCTSLLWLRHFSLSAQVCCCCIGENDSLSFFFQAVTDRCAPAFGAFFYWFSVWRRRRRSAWSWRSTVGGSFFFLSSPLELPAIRLEGILLTPSLVGLLLQYTRNPRQTGRKRKRSSTHRRSPATNKVVEILILGTYLLLDHSFDYLRASPSNSRDTPLWSYDFAFLEKALKKWRKLPPHRNKRPKTKK